LQPVGANRPGAAISYECIEAPLVFERVRVCLYQAFASKCDALGGLPGGPTSSELQSAISAVVADCELLDSWARSLATSERRAPRSRDLLHVARAGLLSVVVDPTTTLLEGLDALLTAELFGRARWSELVTAAQEVGDEDLVHELVAALRVREDRMRGIRDWLRRNRADCARGESTDRDAVANRGTWHTG
jgi:hypothetical protein